jgi:HEAT repeat protein
MRAIEVIGLTLFVASIVFILVLTARRSYVGYQARRRSVLVAQLRPLAIAFVEGDADGGVPEYRGLEGEVCAELIGGYSRLLRGEARERIAAYFEATGGVDEQLRRLHSRRAWRRATAAFMLGDMSSHRVVPALLGLLDDPARPVRMAAARSLGRLDAIDAIEPLVESAIDGRLPRDVTGLALFDLGTAAVPRLLELSASDEPAVRASALELVGLLGEAGDAAPVLNRMSDPAAAVRAASADALGRLGAAEARDALVRALDDRVPGVRAAAARALGQTGGRRAAAALLPVARTDSFEPAHAAAHALARIDPALVVEAAADPDSGPHLREAADLVRL